MEILRPLLDLFSRYVGILNYVAMACIILTYVAQIKGNWRLLYRSSWVLLVLAVPFALLSLLVHDMFGVVVWGLNAFFSYRVVRRH